MLKSMKYDFRRNAGVLVAVAVILLIAEAFFLITNYTREVEELGLPMVLLLFLSLGLFIFVLIYGVLLYSKDLSTKAGYLTFMAPISSTKLIVSKLLSTFLIGTVILLVLIGFAVLDIFAITNAHPTLGTFFQLIEIFAEGFGFDVSGILGQGLIVFVTLVIGVFTTVGSAYFCMTISATLFQNKRYKGIISFLLFLVLTWAVNNLSNLLPTLDVNVTVMTDAFLYMLPSFLFNVVMIVIYVAASSYLLNKKVSL